MRDAHRLKDKVEVSLDGGQVAGLVVGALACLGVVFASGVVVGKRLAGHVEPREPADVLAALDKKSEGDRKVMEAARGEGLQERLTTAVAAPKPPPAAPPPPPAPAPAPVKKAPEPVLAAVAEPVVPARPAPAALPTPPAPSGDWTVQVAATQEKGDADRRSSELRARGLDPVVSGATVPGKGKFWRVQVGRFKSRDDAERYKSDLAREGGFQAFVTKIGT